jgi:hypothetical protein
VTSVRPVHRRYERLGCHTDPLWRDQMSPDDAVGFESLAGTLLLDLGYEQGEESLGMGKKGHRLVSTDQSGWPVPRLRGQRCAETDHQAAHALSIEGVH